MAASGEPLRIGWFTTGRGAGSRGMYEAVHGAIEGGELDASLAFVFANREPGENPVTDGFFDLVRGHDVPLVTRSSVRYRRSVNGERSRPGEPLPAWRVDYDELIAADLRAHRFDIGVLAGYMLIFTAGFVERHPTLNLHPALPGGPIGTWREVIRELIRDGAEESGVMAHLAIPAVDEGPVIAHCRYTIRGGAFDAAWGELEGRIESIDDVALELTALFAAIRERGVSYEAPFLVAALAEFAAGRLHIEGARVLDADGRTATPSDVTAAVEQRMRSVAPAPGG